MTTNLTTTKTEPIPTINIYTPTGEHIANHIAYALNKHTPTAANQKTQAPAPTPCRGDKPPTPTICYNENQRSPPAGGEPYQRMNHPSLGEHQDPST